MKKTIFLMLMLMFSFSVFGISQSSEWNFDQLTILDTNKNVISISNSNYLTFNVIDSSGAVLNNNLVTCDFYLYNISNQLILNSSLVNDVNGVDKYVLLSGVNVLSEYNYKVICNSSTEYGFLVNGFEVIRSGENPYNVTLTNPHAFWISSKSIPYDLIKKQFFIGYITGLFAFILAYGFRWGYKYVSEDYSEDFS